MSSPRASTPGEILLALRRDIALFLEWDAARITLTAVPPREVPHYRGTSDVLLHAGRDERVSPVQEDGGGRYYVDRRRHLDVVCRVRASLDQKTADDLVRLTDDSLGLLALEGRVIDILYGRFGVGEDGDMISFPLVCGDWGAPEHDAKDASWISSSLSASFEYQYLVTLPEVVPVEV